MDFEGPRACWSRKHADGEKENKQLHFAAPISVPIFTGDYRNRRTTSLFEAVKDLRDDGLTDRARKYATKGMRMNIKHLRYSTVVFLVIVASSGQIRAQDSAATGIKVENPWSRATPA